MVEGPPTIHRGRALRHPSKSTELCAPTVNKTQTNPEPYPIHTPTSKPSKASTYTIYTAKGSTATQTTLHTYKKTVGSRPNY